MSNTGESWTCKLRTEVFCKQIPSLVERQNLPQEVQWQISPPSPRYYQSNEPIILICVFVKISTNPSVRVRSWPWCLHESEIQVQGNQRFFFLAAWRLSRSSLMRRKIKKNLWDQGTKIDTGWKTIPFGAAHTHIVHIRK